MITTRHWRWAALPALALVLAACGTASSPSASASKGTTTSAAASPTPAASTPAEVAFVSDARSSFNIGASLTDSDLVSLASAVCAGAADHLSASALDLIPAARGVTFSGSSGAAGPAQIVALAIKDLCPQDKPAATVILRMSGSGIENSAPVTVTSGTLTVRYSFDCSSFGSSGNFIADFETPDQASLSSDDQTIANALAVSGHATTTIYPTNIGSKYYLAVNSECDWTVVIKSP